MSSRSGSPRSGGPRPGSEPSAPAEGDRPAPAPAEELTERDRRILALESRTFRFVGTKERRIREELGMTPTAYLVRLNALLESPAALREAPALVHRLRGLRTREDDHRPGPAHAA